MIKKYYFNIINKIYKEYKVIKFKFYNQLNKKLKENVNSYGINEIICEVINTPCLEIIVKKEE